MRKSMDKELSSSYPCIAMVFKRGVGRLWKAMGGYRRI
jgi:hypothetical protein